MKHIDKFVLAILVVCLIAVQCATSQNNLVISNVYAANSDVQHCTDWPLAGLKDRSTGASRDDVIDHYTASVDIRPSPTGPTVQMSLNAIPNSAGWRVLIRPNQPFAVFYTIDASSPDAISDPSSTASYYDDDWDTLPDYVERVHSCLSEAHERYKRYYNLTSEQETGFSHWLNISYTDPTSPTHRIDKEFYLVIMQRYDRLGAVIPILIPMADAPPHTTFMIISSLAQGFLQRDSMPWLYPGLENIVYHELAHTYQGIYKSIWSPDDYLGNWIYEGTAVFMTDQAFYHHAQTTR